MLVKIAKWGNSLGLRLPRSVAEEAGLRAGQLVEVVARGGGVEATPATAIPHYRLEDLVAEADRLGPENRPAFEDWGVLPSEWPDEDWSDIAPTDAEMGIKHAHRRRPISRRR
jgi:antitoxin MazE